jgi:hypothetical protein
MVYQIINSSHPLDQSYKDALHQVANDLAQLNSTQRATVWRDIKAAPPGGDTPGGVMGHFYANNIFSGCDGAVAIDVIGFTAQSLATDTQNNTQTYSPLPMRRYPGYDSPNGCGTNSDYSVTWTVTPVHGPVLSVRPPSGDISNCLANPVYPSLTVINEGDRTLNWKATTDDPANNVKVKPPGGMLVSGTPQTVTLSGVPTAGTSELHIIFTSDGGDVRVTLFCPV